MAQKILSAYLKGLSEYREWRFSFWNIFFRFWDIDVFLLRLAHACTHALAHSRTRALTHSRTHSLTHSRTHALTHSLTQLLHSVRINLCIQPWLFRRVHPWASSKDPLMVIRYGRKNKVFNINQNPTRAPTPELREKLVQILNASLNNTISAKIWNWTPYDVRNPER